MSEVAFVVGFVARTATITLCTARASPVPQAPGLLLDTFSFMMALCASLKPGWDLDPSIHTSSEDSPLPQTQGRGQGQPP